MVRTEAKQGSLGPVLKEMQWPMCPVVVSTRAWSRTRQRMAGCRMPRARRHMVWLCTHAARPGSDMKLVATTRLFEKQSTMPQKGLGSESAKPNRFLCHTFWGSDCIPSLSVRCDDELSTGWPPLSIRTGISFSSRLACSGLSWTNG